MNELGTGESSTVRFWFHHGQPPLAGSSVVPKPFEAFDHDSSVGPILVLNLERQVERWKLFQSEARRHQLRNGGSLLDRCERVTAVDGLTAPVGSFLPSEIDAIYSLEDFYFVDPQPVLSQLGTRAGLTVTESPQEMAVAQSHLNAWKRVANDGVTTLVVEDDAQFLHDFESRLARICAELPDIGASEPTFDLLYLSYRSAESGMERITYSESLFRPIRGLWWLSGYVLTPRGATKLLEGPPSKNLQSRGRAGPVSINIEKRCNHYRLIVACMLAGSSRERAVIVGWSTALRGQVINESLGQLPKKLAASSVAGSYGCRRFREFFP